ncbi:MAG: hypothetical protein QHH13_13965 [Melioribacter sp.]|uniref:hypothetical protein n=1 Tax=Rosettibacter primus TaxID=3111523 RepID=UPI00247D843B|nr:hypothetical protein [Melioribacter sp.]
MKKSFLIIMSLTLSIYAQSFVVEKIDGNVLALIGFNEEWTKVKVGQILKGTDLISTGEKSLIQLNNNGNRFILQSNSALSINNIKKISLNELLLALAMEEIRNVPNFKENNSRRNTAVYGEKVSNVSPNKSLVSDLGIKKLNGAKQLAINGYRESAILLAKETYRKYPETKSRIDDRLFFVNLMIELQLFNEAATDLYELEKMKLTKEQHEKVEHYFEIINDKILKNN